MKIRPLPAVLALLILVAAWSVYLRPSQARLSAIDQQVQLLSTQVATLQSQTVISPRIRAERRVIAARLRTVSNRTVVETEASLLKDLTRLAAQNRLRVVSLNKKDQAMPLAPTAPATVAPAPTPVAAATTAAGVPAPASTLSPSEVSVTVPGIRLPRELVVSGSFGGIVRFVDALGSLPELCRVANVRLSQTNHLTATITFDAIVLDGVKLSEAQRL